MPFSSDTYSLPDAAARPWYDGAPSSGDLAGISFVVERETVAGQWV